MEREYLDLTELKLIVGNNIVDVRISLAPRLGMSSLLRSRPG
jgi:hypothetical protein